MDGLRAMYWFFLIVVWIELVAVYWLLWKNKRRLKELDELKEVYEKAIAAFRFAQSAYEEKLAELREEEVSDAGND